MRRFGLFSILFVSGLATASGCMPVRFLDNVGAGGSSGDPGFGGAGGSITITGKSDTSSGSTSSGMGSGGGSNDGGAGPTGPLWYGYLCGGSQATCSPDPGSSDCAPGGNPGMGGAPADGGTSKLACQLVADGGQVISKCGMAGSAVDGDPCNQATDCQAGFGCGATYVTGVCRQYCCGDPESCPASTYCAPTKMAESAEEVPLCVLVKGCTLLDDSHCDAGETCTIVRADGTTGCAKAGPHVEGEACPCAAGFLCSNATGSCLKLCHLGSDECGASGSCQPGTIPASQGVGVCIPQ